MFIVSIEYEFLEKIIGLVYDIYRIDILRWLFVNLSKKNNIRKGRDFKGKENKNAKSCFHFLYKIFKYI